MLSYRSNTPSVSSKNVHDCSRVANAEDQTTESISPCAFTPGHLCNQCRIKPHEQRANLVYHISSRGGAGRPNRQRACNLNAASTLENACIASETLLTCPHLCRPAQRLSNQRWSAAKATREQKRPLWWQRLRRRVRASVSFPSVACNDEAPDEFEIGFMIYGAYWQ